MPCAVQSPRARPPRHTWPIWRTGCGFKPGSLSYMGPSSPSRAPNSDLSRSKIHNAWTCGARKPGSNHSLPTKPACGLSCSGQAPAPRERTHLAADGARCRDWRSCRDQRARPRSMRGRGCRRQRLQRLVQRGEDDVRAAFPGWCRIGLTWCRRPQPPDVLPVIEYPAQGYLTVERGRLGDRGGACGAGALQYRRDVANPYLQQPWPERPALQPVGDHQIDAAKAQLDMDQLAVGHLGSHFGVLRHAEDTGDEVDKPGGVIDDDERIEYCAAGGNRLLGKQNLTGHARKSRRGPTVPCCQADGSRPDLHRVG